MSRHVFLIASSSLHSQADEPVDRKPEIEEACKASCVKQFAAYEACKERIAAKGQGTCEPFAIDAWHCVDKCVSFFRLGTLERRVVAKSPSMGLTPALAGCASQRDVVPQLSSVNFSTLVCFAGGAQDLCNPQVNGSTG